MASSCFCIGCRVPNPSDENNNVKGVIQNSDNPFLLLVPRAVVPSIRGHPFKRHLNIPRVVVYLGKETNLNPRRCLMRGLYAGFDLHGNSNYLGIIDGDGKRVFGKKLRYWFLLKQRS